jgi:hypothetical protein
VNTFALSPAHAPARDARARIDAIANSLRTSEARRLDRNAVADRLARAICALYIVLDTTPEAPAHHDALDECARVLGEARPFLGAAADDGVVAEALASLDAVRKIVADARESVVDRMITTRNPRSAPPPALTKPFHASTALPQLHALARAPELPPLALDGPPPESLVKPKAPPPPKPKTLEELRAMAAAPPPEDEVESEGRAAKAAAKPPTMSDDGEVVRRVARECLEDIAGLRVLRKPIATETWRDQLPFEQRLLDNIDAFASLGGRALPSITLFHAEAPAPDPSRAFAVALTLGCIEGSDTIDVAIATMKQAAPEEMPGFAEGWILAPSSAIDVELPALLLAPNPAQVGLALDVLGARGTLPLDTSERVLERNDPSLHPKLARALGSAGAKTKALATLNDMIDRVDFDVRIATSLLRRGDANIRHRLRSAMPGALPLLAISGRADDAQMLVNALEWSPSVLGIRAMARFGSIEALPILIALLDSEEEAIPPACAWALDFITNAGLVEVKEVPWSPESTATRKVTTPIADRVKWEQWYSRVKNHFDPRIKLRRGLPFTPSMIVDELRAVGASEHRDDAALELVVTTGLGLRFSTRDWVRKQDRQLAEIADVIPTLGSATGAWWYAGAAITSR